MDLILIKHIKDLKDENGLLKEIYTNDNRNPDIAMIIIGKVVAPISCLKDNLRLN